MSVTQQFIDKTKEILTVIEQQEEAIQKAASWFAESILAGRMVHVFGSGHSRIMVEEMWPRYGSFPGFNPIVELSLTFHNLVVGANGQRQAMFLENVPGLAARILRNYKLSEVDTALVISSSGCNVVPVEMAELFAESGIKVVALVTSRHAEKSRSKRADGKKLTDFADLILDTGAPAGDAMIQIPGLQTPVAPGSTVGGAIIINSIKAETAKLLTEAGRPPKVLTAEVNVGAEKAKELFESAYDEHAHRLAKLYEGVGYSSYVSKNDHVPGI
ncbi:sugar isomerase domain-containing protein [Dyadobacter bucti]|uniref:sugar isomerase domain-containing protein n=1 Tax=Dyadobacter bucti TaxID=2572203 RepID=UPI003F6F2815